MLKLAVMLNIGVSRFTRLGFLHEIEKGDIDWRPQNSAGVNTIRIGLVVPSQRDLSPPAEQFARRTICTGLPRCDDASHSTTSSAVTSNVCGIERPSALAAFRLIANS
jgi:hypothetical protein